MEKKYDGEKHICSETYISGDGSMRIKYDPEATADEEFRIFSLDSGDWGIDLDEEGVKTIIERLQMFLDTIIRD